MLDNETVEDRPEAVTLGLRLIRSFRHRNVRHVPLHNVSLDWTPARLQQEILNRVIAASDPLGSSPAVPRLPPPFRKPGHFDCLKIEHQAFGAKTNNPVINLGNDEHLILDASDSRCLAELGVKNETEVSFFNRSDYEEFKKDPQTIF